ncbi:MAG: pilus assembly protein [Methylacidiphilales bacterium]|nr:pilus assembly protein [Candidatus Methylacidiphilales bacterium]
MRIFNKGARRKGQAVVEFALIVPLLLTMMLGIVEFGWLIQNEMTLANAAREAARAAALGNTTTYIQTRATTMASPLTISTDTMAYSTDNGTTWLTWPSDSGSNNGVPSGALIKITLTATNHQLTNFIPGLNSLLMSQFAVMRREPT